MNTLNETTRKNDDVWAVCPMTTAHLNTDCLGSRQGAAAIDRSVVSRDDDSLGRVSHMHARFARVDAPSETEFAYIDRHDGAWPPHCTIPKDRSHMRPHSNMHVLPRNPTLMGLFQVSVSPPTVQRGECFGSAMSSSSPPVLRQ